MWRFIPSRRAAGRQGFALVRVICAAQRAVAVLIVLCFAPLPISVIGASISWAALPVPTAADEEVGRSRARAPLDGSPSFASALGYIASDGSLPYWPAGTGGPMINEVLYDPEGPDSGSEFVELITSGAEPVCLEGWSLRGGDGSKPSAWRTIWEGTAGDTLRPGRVFLIAEAEVKGADAVTKLALQNGPDCCALAFDGRDTDIVGWGKHEFSEYYEGNPASDVSSGHSLARLPDGADSGDNSVDFVDCPEPTPGRRNILERDISFGQDPVDISPINPEAHDRVKVRATVANTGLAAASSDQLTLLIRTKTLDGGRPVFRTEIPFALAAGDTTVLDAVWEPTSDGAFRVEAFLTFEGDQDTTGNRADLYVRVGTGPAIINEIMYDPDAGGEWIEIFNRTERHLNLLGWSVVDKAGGRAVLPAHALLSPGGYLVVAQDSVGLVESFTSLGPESVVGSYAGRWPSLNNSDGADGVADAVALSDSVGVLSDRAVYGESLGAGMGLSLERVRADLTGGRSDNWCPSGGLSGATPGRENSVRAGGGTGDGVLKIEPEIIDAAGGAGPAAVNYSLPFRPSRVELLVYNMSGLEVAKLMERREGPSKGTVLWDGRGSKGRCLASGAYVLLLVADGAGGERTKAKAVAVVK